MRPLFTVAVVLAIIELRLDLLADKIGSARREAATSGLRHVFLDILSHDDIRNVVKKNESKAGKTPLA